MLEKITADMVGYRPMLNRTRIVLVNTSHPGNIGSAARAMKTMGLEKLYLVAPQHFPHEKSYEMCSGAADILDKAVVVQTLEEATADCTLVVGTSTRARTIPWPISSPREMAEKIRQEPAEGESAIVFGREQSGLTNEELHLCHVHIQIPANPEYTSLNLASAVQVVAYELRIASLDESPIDTRWDYKLSTADDMEKFFAHLQQVLIDIDFLKLSAPRKLMVRLRRLFYRARPDMMEMNMLRGILAAVQENKAHSRDR